MRRRVSHRRRHGWLTYARSPNEPEDISLFDRARDRRTSRSTPRPRSSPQRGRFYSEDDDESYDVEHYTLDVTFDPARSWISGARVAARADQGVVATSSLTFRLAQSLAVSSVSSPHVRLSARAARRRPEQRARQPAAARSSAAPSSSSTSRTAAGSIRSRSIAKRSRWRPQIQEPQAPPQADPSCSARAAVLYSNRVYWYPQAPVTDYATATMRLTVPSEYQVVASGSRDQLDRVAGARRSTRQHPTIDAHVEYSADRPVRYLACVISRFVPVGSATVEVPASRRRCASAGRPARPARRRQHRSRLDAAHDRPQPADCSRASPSVMRFYAKTIGEAPYPDFTLAALDDNLPGGHSPRVLRGLSSAAADDAVLVVGRSGGVRQHLSVLLSRARNRAPVVGPGGRLEELSRAVDERGTRAVLRGALRRSGSRPGHRSRRCIARHARRRPIARLSQGPISLGYRLGHIQSDGRVFRGDRLQQVRGRAAHAAAADRRRGVLRRAPAVLPRLAVQEGGHGRPPRGVRDAARRCRSGGSSIAGFSDRRSRSCV